jgi:hypothetical protein
MGVPSKKLIIFISILLVIAVILVFVYLSFVSSKTISARLLVEKGNVFVNDKEVTGNYILRESDKVSTSETGIASIILYESIVVNLEPNTVIIVEDLVKKNPKLSQEKGETWSQFTKLFGVESYTIKTSTSVASVRGTGFSLTDSLLLVGEGNVAYNVNGQSYSVEGGKAIERFGESVRERELTSEEKQKVKEKKLEAINALKELRLLEIAKHKKTVDFLKSKYGFTEEDIKSTLEEADNGKMDLKEFKDKVPVKVDSIEKVIQITEKIKELKSSL